MTIILDDSHLHPVIDADLLLYISSLNEDHTIYTRFFDALLIKRDQHLSFFKDLKAFRQQPRVIVLLEQSRKDRTKLKETTLTFFGSRFCHPWCGGTALNRIWWHIELGLVNHIRKDPEIEKENLRMHKLLVPIWIIMRSKMFPGEEIVKSWCVEERSRLKQEARKARSTTKLNQRKMAPENNSIRHTDDDLGEEDFQFVSKEEAMGEESQSAADAATSVFRMAAAGVLLSQTPKRKLRWLLKKS